MKKFKRALVKLILLAMFLMMYTESGAEELIRFPDVPATAWYMDDLQHILKDPRKIFSGYPDGTFKPNDTLTVDMYIKLIVTAMGHQVENGKEYWASTYIEKALDEGYIIKNVDNFTNAVNFWTKDNKDPYAGYKTPITREDMAQITGRALDKITADSDYRDLLAVSGLIKDYNSLPVSSKMNIVKCYDLGIITGYPDGEFKPFNILTRAEAVAVVRRLIDPAARKITPLPVVANPSPTPIPVAELNRPAKKDLGNGVVEVEGVRFDPAKDVADSYGAMEILKAEEFVGVALEYLQFYEHEGKARVKGYIPELPDGYTWKMAIKYGVEKRDDRGSLGVSLYTEEGLSPEQTLPSPGNSFDRSLYTNKENINTIYLLYEIVNSRNSSGGNFYISFTLKKYSRQDIYGKHSYVTTFDPRGFIEW